MNHVLRTLVHDNIKTIHTVLRTLVHANLNTILNVLRTLVHTSPPHNMAQARDIINELATAMHAMQTTVATTVRSIFRFSCLCSRYVFESAADC